MHVQSLDYSDANAMNSELAHPDYRVDFWEQVGAPGVGAVKTAYGVSNHLLSQVDDVQQALEWATENAGNRSFVLFAVVPREGKPSLLVRLLGSDPTQQGSRQT